MITRALYRGRDVAVNHQMSNRSKRPPWRDPGREHGNLARVQSLEALCQVKNHWEWTPALLSSVGHIARTPSERLFDAHSERI